MKHLMQGLLATLALAGGVAVAGPVNINTADAATLARELSGVGIARAEAIVQYREAHGPFTAAEELTRVQGIGPAILDANRGDIRIEDDD